MHVVSVQDVDGKYAVDVALKGGHLTTAALLEADPVKVYIHDAAFEGKTLLVAALIKQGCPTTFRDDRPDETSKSKFRLSLRSMTPLMAACIGGQYETVRMMLTKYPDTVIPCVNERDCNGRTALMLAARSGNLEITSLLLNAKADRHLRDNKGNSARDHALAHGLKTMIQFMSQQMIH
jgi:hypothetical protein